jgi:transcriptional regulator with XRE-family HTH domain
VLHRCDNPPRVRPLHLFLGDATDNNRDRQQKGRTRGWAGRVEDAHHAFRVTAAQTSQMLVMRRSGATQQDIADVFGVSRGHVSKILRGQTVASRKAA